MNRLKESKRLIVGFLVMISLLLIFWEDIGKIGSLISSLFQEESKPSIHNQAFEIDIPLDSLVRIDGVLARKNDTIKFSQIGPPKEFFWIGLENTVRITTPVYYCKVWKGNDEVGRELQIWVKGGKEKVKLRIEVIPHS